MIYTYLLLATTVMVVVRLLTSRKIYEFMLCADLISNITVLYLTIFAYAKTKPFYLDIAIVLAMLSFTGTLAVTRYVVER